MIKYKNSGLIIAIICIITLLNNVNYTDALKVAFLCTSGPEDLGFNYQVVEAKTAVEKALKLRESYYFSDIPIPEGYAFIENLIKEEGFNAILIATLDYYSAGLALSKIYTNVYFLLRGSSTSTANVMYITYNFAAANYLTGFFAGLTTKTKILGYVEPGPPSMKTFGSKAFYVGAKRGMNSTDFTTFLHTIGSWSNPPVSTAAANDILDKGADVLGQTQDDMSVSLAAIDRGLGGLGTNGYAQSRVFGDKISFGYIMNWTDCFMSLLQPLSQGIKPNLTSYYGDYNNGFLTSEYSRKIDTRVRAAIDQEVTNLNNLGRPNAYFLCDSVNTYIWASKFFTSGNGCLTQGTWQNTSDPYPSIIWNGNYTIPFTLKPVPTSFIYGFTITSGILIALCLLMEGVVYINRFKPVIRSASPIFCILIIAGGIIVYTGIILWTVTPTTALCRSRYWLVSLGFTTLIGSLVVKNFRIWLIFDNPELKTIKITNFQLFPWIAGLIAINSLLVGLMTGLGDIKMVSVTGVDDLGDYEYMYQCQIGDHRGLVSLYILLAYFAVLLLVGVFVSWKIRIVDIEEFNESKPIANTLYAISFSLFIIVALVVSPQYYINENIILCTAALFIATAALSILFIPKVYRLVIHGSKSSTDIYGLNKKKSSVANSRFQSSKSSSGGKSGDSDSEGHSAVEVNNNNTHVLADFSDDEDSDKQSNNIEISTDHHN